MRFLYSILFILLCTISVVAQTPPETDVWLAPINPANLAVDVPSARNVTNRAGYDNQPSFTPDGGFMLYTSYRGNQTDIYRFSLKTGRTEAMTQTPESEYSPSVIPGGKRFSVVRVESDDTQRLWSFDFTQDDPQLVFPFIKPVGYYAWADAKTVGMFVLGNPASFQVAKLPGSVPVTVSTDIMRSVRFVPGTRSISFVQKKDTSSFVMIYNSDQETTRTKAPTFPGKADHAWTPDAQLLMANGSSLYRWAEHGEQWQLIGAFSPRGITNITRLAVSPDGKWLAFVADH